MTTSIQKSDTPAMIAAKFRRGVLAMTADQALSAIIKASNAMERELEKARCSGRQLRVVK